MQIFFKIGKIPWLSKEQPMIRIYTGQENMWKVFVDDYLVHLLINLISWVIKRKHIIIWYTSHCSHRSCCATWVIPNPNALCLRSCALSSGWWIVALLHTAAAEWPKDFSGELTAAWFCVIKLVIINGANGLADLDSAWLVTIPTYSVQWPQQTYISCLIDP